MKAIRKEGVREMKMCLLRMAVMLTAACVATCSLTYMALSRVPLADLLTVILKTALPFIPLLAFAYLFGCCGRGSVERLEVRLCMATYVVFCLLVLVHVIGFSSTDLLSESSGIRIQGLDASFDLTPICMLLLIVPLCMIADALAEYYQYRGNKDEKR